MMRKWFLVGVLIILLIVFIVIGRLPKNVTEVSSVGNVIKDNDSRVSGSVKTISSDELKSHDSETDCWIAYDGKVYDITSFLPKHPGGIERITPYCGTADEFQNAFEKQHGTSKVKFLLSVGVLMGDFEIKGNIK